MALAQHILVLNPSGCAYVAETDRETGRLERVSSDQVHRSDDDFIDPITREVLTDEMIRDWLDQDMDSGENAEWIEKGGDDYSLFDAGTPA